MLPAIYAELVRWDATGQPFPFLAESVPTLENGLARFIGTGEDQQLEVEFRLRPGAVWQDGQPVTAADLAFSWKLVMSPDWPSPHWGHGGPSAELYVDSVVALDGERVAYRFMSQRQARQAAENGGRLQNPEQYAGLKEQFGPVVPLDYLDVGRNVFPQHLLQGIPVSDIAASDFAFHPVYAGAYRLVEGGPDGAPVVLKAFEGFFLGKAQVERVVFGANYYSPDLEPYWQAPEQLGEALKNGEVQAQLSFPGVNIREGADPRAYDALQEQGLAQVTWQPRDSWEVLDFNLDKPAPGRPASAPGDRLRHR